VVVTHIGAARVDLLNPSKSLMRRFLFAVALVLAGCLSPTEPRLDADVRVPDELTAEIVPAGAVTWARFRIPTTITNTGATALRFHHCSFSIEAAAEERTVWSPVCLLVAGGEQEIPPGVTREWIVDVGAAISGPGGPDWDAESLAGTYRLRMAFHELSGDRSETRASNAFVLSAD
jgi:hypothetical protein